MLPSFKPLHLHEADQLYARCSGELDCGFSKHAICYHKADGAVMKSHSSKDLLHSLVVDVTGVQLRLDSDSRSPTCHRDNINPLVSAARRDGRLYAMAP